MNLLLDTHIVLWVQFEPTLLRAHERLALTTPNANIWVSTITFWEMRLKFNTLDPTGRRKHDINPQLSLAVAHSLGWQVLNVTALHATASLQTALTHRDPFDEMLLIQAQEDGLALLTRDTKLIRHPCAFQF